MLGDLPGCDCVWVIHFFLTNFKYKLFYPDQVKKMLFNIKPHNFCNNFLVGLKFVTVYNGPIKLFFTS